MRAGHTVPGRRRLPLALRLITPLLLLGGAALGYFNFPKPVSPDRIKVQLLRVSDGDTLLLEDADGRELKVRLVGIDAPELGSSESFRSALQTAELLEQARSIELEPEPRSPTDRYGRILGWVFIELPDGSEVLLQEELIKGGNAELFRRAEGSKYYGRLQRAQQP